MLASQNFMHRYIKNKLNLFRYEYRSRGFRGFLQYLLTPKSVRKIRKYFFIGAVTFAVISATLSLIAYAMYKNDESYILRSLAMYSEWMDGKGNFPEKPPVKIFSSNGTLLGEYLVEHNSRMTLKTCKNLKWLNSATVSGEDREFYTHNGISYRGILRAFVNNILSFRPREGAGSITQQLARNLFTTKSMPVVLRKIYETYAAFLIEEHMNKDQILCLYLNKIYMGEGRYGAEEASYFYFRKPPVELNAAEAAMIVGLYPSPVRYSPLNNIESSMKKQKMVLESMSDNGYFKEDEIEKSIENFIKKYGIKIISDSNSLFTGSGPSENKGEEFSSPGKVGLYGANRFFRKNLAPDVNEYVRHFLLSNSGDNEIVTPGLSVYTTIDYTKQKAATYSIRSSVEAIRNRILADSDLPHDEVRNIIDGYNGVFVAMDPETGNIRAMVGGFRMAEDQYMDRVWNMLRQPGSSIKGFLYAVALDEEVLSEDTMVTDGPVSIAGYEPKNWYAGYRGEISLKKAVALSVNTVAVNTLNDIGPGKFKRRMSQAADISSARFDANLSLALGSGEVTPVELARLYGVLLNSGKKVNPRLIEKVISPEGDVLFEYPAEKSSEKIISSKAAKLTIQLLKQVIEDEEGTASWIGKRKKTNNLNFPIAGKTGTVRTDESVKKKYGGMKGVHDAWFVALVPGEVNVVWMGHDSGAPFEGSGSGTAAGAWMFYAEQALKNRTKNRFSLFDEDSTPFESLWDRFKKRKKKDLNSEDSTDLNNTNSASDSETVPANQVDDIFIPEQKEGDFE